MLIAIFSLLFIPVVWLFLLFLADSYKERKEKLKELEKRLKKQNRNWFVRRSSKEDSDEEKRLKEHDLDWVVKQPLEEDDDEQKHLKHQSQNWFYDDDF
ncbi:MAG: hypothetical protein Q4D80_05675 [Pseudomonadota bacterium]|nr:hypothetical protein [Pseudomonadota bacterium]